MEQPPGFCDPNLPHHVCRLNKALYGLKQAPRAWFQRLCQFLTKNGFACSRSDTSLFVFKRDACLLYLLVYVDDVIIIGNDASLIRSFIAKLNAEFGIHDLGKLNYFLGLEVTHTSTGLFLSQKKYAHDILDRAKLLDAKPVPTPLASNAAFVTNGDLYSNPTHYRSLVGALQYLTITRPDIAYAVNQVSRFLQAPCVAHYQSVKRILRYINGTLTFGLSFSKPLITNLYGYSDADWARCVETHRSTYGYSIFLGGNIVSWSAKKQPTISRSSCESEYRAMANTAAEIICITHLLKELHALPPSRPALLCDNQSALFLTQNPVSHKRSKHIDLDYHFIRELVASGKLHTKFIPTKLQVADIFTKSLPPSQLHAAGFRFYSLEEDKGIQKIYVWEKEVYLPVFTLNKDSDVIIRNLVAYESLTSKSNSFMLAEFIVLMCALVVNVDDVQYLKNVIKGDLHVDEVVKFFTEMSSSMPTMKTIEKSNLKYVEDEDIFVYEEACTMIASGFKGYW
ncbi:hypothetical protein E3N88_41236 [Mikania micrantha]|uniref:Reverse transcriptase Ty1/copia-type domain-containing protein n=1 Tax=Mikania micrantha TaxID=192012 RepID=A0A5N6LPZ4_9ASTR|nr:hypothetical protein E3N88_41236 [Mikania micrantha]